jgi:pimeloyl-ACP methyl ester carboxylesterase
VNSGRPGRGADQLLRRHLIRTRRGHIHVRDWGDTGAPPLVLLHMAPKSGAMFEKVVPGLVEHHRVLCPDRLGFGDSDRISAPLVFAEYAAVTLEALDGLGVEHFCAAGIHTGSCEVVELATAHPERVDRAAIVGVPAFTAIEVATHKAHYSPPPTPKEDGSHLLWYWNWWMRWRTAEWDLDLVQTRVLDHLRCSPLYWLAYHSVFDYPMGERITQVTQPLLVLAPHDDLWTQTERSRSLLPRQAQFVELPHLGVEAFSLAPGEIGGLLSNFFRQAASRESPVADPETGR